MKKILLLLWALLVLQLAGCEKDAAATGTTSAGAEPIVAYSLPVPPEDRNQSFLHYAFVETVDGYYFENNQVIYFCPRDQLKCVPLCCKPNCEHKDDDCNARGYGLGYYDGSLYTVRPSFGDDLHFELLKVNADGTGCEVVKTMENLEGYSFSFTTHHGKAFFVYGPDGNMPLEEQKTRLVVMDLLDYSLTEPAADYLQTAILPDINSYYEDKLYLNEAYDENWTYRPDKEKLIELDAVTGRARTVYSGCASAIYVTDSVLYFMEPDSKAVTDMFGVEMIEGNPGFREVNLETGAVKDCGPVADGALYATYDENYIYVRSAPRNEGRDQTVYIYSRDYKLVDQLELTDGLEIFNITSDRVFFYKWNGSNRSVTCCLEKAKIGSGSLTLDPVEFVAAGRAAG